MMIRDKKEYDDISKRVMELIDKNVEPDSDEGRELNLLSEHMVSYEAGHEAGIASMREDKVTRFEVIDHTKDGEGRILVKHDIKLTIELQDDNRTLKVFLDNR